MTNTNLSTMTIGEFRTELNALQEGFKKIKKEQPRWEEEERKIAKYGKALAEAGIAGTSVASSLATIGGTAARFAGPIGMIVGSLVLLTELILEYSSATSDATKNTGGYVNALERLRARGELRRNQERDLTLLLERQNELQQEILRPITAHQPAQRKLTPDQEALYRTLGKMEPIFKSPAEELQFVNQMVGELKLTLGLHRDILNLTSDASVKTSKEANLPEIAVTGKWRALEPIQFQPNLGLPKLSKVPTTPPEQIKKQAKETFVEFTALSESFQNSFSNGMNAVGQSINQSIGGMFRGVFGEANSLLEIFIANFVSSMASNVLSLLTGGTSGGLLSILGFAKGGVINEPIFGIGKSGQRYLFGEAGSEAIVPLSNMAAMQASHVNNTAMIKPTVVVTPLISSKGLAVQVEVGNRMNSRSRV